MSYDIPYIWNLRKKWYKWTYLQNRTRLRLTKWTYGCQGKGHLGSLRWSYIHAIFKWITNKGLPYSTWNSDQCYVAAWVGGRFREERVHVYIYSWVPLLFTWNYHSFVNHLCVYVCSVAQSCSTFCSPMDCSLPGSSVHRIFQAYWSGLPFPTLGELPDPGTKPASLASLALAGGFFTTVPPGKPC